MSSPFSRFKFSLLQFYSFAGYQDKRYILEMLAIKVAATPEKVNIDGIIPLDSMFSQLPDDSSNLLTTGQNIGMSIRPYVRLFCAIFLFQSNAGQYRTNIGMYVNP